jgi:hypothetical protein
MDKQSRSSASMSLPQGHMGLSQQCGNSKGLHPSLVQSSGSIQFNAPPPPPPRQGSLHPGPVVNPTPPAIATPANAQYHGHQQEEISGFAQVGSGFVQGPYNHPPSSNATPERWFDLGGQRYVTVKIWKGRLYVGLRQFVFEGGQWKSTRNGINLTHTEWAIMHSHMEDINSAVCEIAPHATYWP